MLQTKSKERYSNTSRRAGCRCTSSSSSPEQILNLASKCLFSPDGNQAAGGQHTNVFLPWMLGKGREGIASPNPWNRMSVEESLLQVTELVVLNLLTCNIKSANFSPPTLQKGSAVKQLRPELIHKKCDSFTPRAFLSVGWSVKWFKYQVGVAAHVLSDDF